MKQASRQRVHPTRASAGSKAQRKKSVQRRSWRRMQAHIVKNQDKRILREAGSLNTHHSQASRRKGGSSPMKQASRQRVHPTRASAGSKAQRKKSVQRRSWRRMQAHIVKNQDKRILREAGSLNTHHSQASRRKASAGRERCAQG